MAWTHQKGLVQGSGNQLSPKANTTRAQVAAIMMRHNEAAAK
ncbi:S-layer homology domain-containing protein [Oscillibacter ruminantium]